MYEEHEIEGGCCPECGEPAKLLACEDCDRQEWTIDCGHMDQPRPLAVDPDGHVRCDGCSTT
jgi:hypothetical protein